MCFCFIVEEGVLCLVIIISDKHCHAEECQQEFQDDNKDIVHNGFRILVIIS